MTACQARSELGYSQKLLACNLGEVSSSPPHNHDIFPSEMPKGKIDAFYDMKGASEHASTIT